MSQKENNSPSQEEQFLMDFFESKKIKYETEVVLPKLQNDTKQYRKADFYLPNLRVYVEYYGLYNSTKDTRKEYDTKTEVYIKNNIPTVFIYPHELGIIDYSFHKKLSKVLSLEKFRLEKEFRRYKLVRFFENIRRGTFGNLVLLMIFLYLTLSTPTGLSKDFNYLINVFLIAGIIINFIGVFKDFKYYYIQNKL